jgi:XTP/dITP diphosphohydrolase
MKEFIFATNNDHKAGEIRHIFDEAYPMLHQCIGIITLKELGFRGDIPETGDTLVHNALQKAQHVYGLFGRNCFADDTGLEIDALDGRPGVYAARYAGEGCSFDDNINKVLREMEGVENRKARFLTVIACIIEGREYFFEGHVNGEILKRREGDKGFGYDPIFRPEGHNTSFASMPLQQKNTISHRAMAFRHFAAFLESLCR